VRRRATGEGGMTLLSVVKDVCMPIGVLQPTSVFSSIGNNRTMQEIASLATEMAQRIAYDTRDWTKLKKTCVFTGDGVATAFNLPANFKRMLLTANVWRSTSALQPMQFIPDTDEWIQRRALNRFSAFGEWTIIGGQMLIWPVMGTGVTATFAYMDKNCISLASSGVGDSFVADGDGFLLDERVLKLGMIWQWKANKGSAYAEDMGTYGDALTIAMGHDSPSPIIIGHKPASAGTYTNIAYPYPVPTP
jgi:hypothetical protein